MFFFIMAEAFPPTAQKRENFMQRCMLKRMHFIDSLLCYFNFIRI